MSNIFSSDVVVSVVCITYNHGRYIRDALDGFLIQRMPFVVEFIVADDCSDDNTVNIINEYKDKFNGALRVVRNESNLGFMKNLMGAMDLSRGKYIAICEGDDYWVDPEKLSIQVSKMEGLPGVDLSFHSAYIKYEVGDKVNSLFCRRAHNDCAFGIEHVIKSAGSFMPTASMMIRGEAYKGLLPGILNLYSGYTTAFFTQLIFSFKKGSLYIDRPMSVYRSMSSGSWTESVVKDPGVYVYWNDKYLDAVRAYNELTDCKYGVLFGKAIADKHFSLLKNEGLTIEYKNEYFAKNKFELIWWQRFIWQGIRYFPRGIYLLKVGRSKLSVVKQKIKLLVRLR